MDTILKIECKGEFRRALLPDVPSYDVLDHAVRETWPGRSAKEAKYRDEEHDLCTLSEKTLPDFLATSRAVKNGRVLKLELPEVDAIDFGLDERKTNDASPWIHIEFGNGTETDSESLHELVDLTDVQLRTEGDRALEPEVEDDSSASEERKEIQEDVCLRSDEDNVEKESSFLEVEEETSQDLEELHSALEAKEELSGEKPEEFVHREVSSNAGANVNEPEFDKERSIIEAEKETSQDVQLRNDEDMWFEAELVEERSLLEAETEKSYEAPREFISSTLEAEKESSGEKPEEFARSRVSSNESVIVYSISTPPPSPASSSREIVDPCQASLTESMNSKCPPVSKIVQRTDDNASAHGHSVDEMIDIIIFAFDRTGDCHLNFDECNALQKAAWGGEIPSDMYKKLCADMNEDPRIGLGRDALICVYCESASCSEIIDRDFKVAKRKLEGYRKGLRQQGGAMPLRSCAWEAVSFLPKRLASRLSAHAKRERGFFASCM
jgi:hypothetical protein